MNSCPHDILPPPQDLRPGPATTLLPQRLRVCIKGPDPARALRRAVQEELGRLPGLTPVFGTTPAADKAGPPLRLAVADPAAKGFEERVPNAADRRTLARSHGQGYLLRAEARRQEITLTGAGPAGLRHGLSTLRQWLRPDGDGRWILRDVRIRDYPDFEYRSLDWLINAEANRWCYDVGEGREAFVARVCRALDRARDLRLNIIHFDGFGWDTNRFPGFADLMRQLNGEARARGIRLIFGGYGGGYGAVYQRQFQKQGRYWGQVFQNRRGYPDGPVYACLGMGGTHYPPETIAYSRTLGTCPSNPALRALKIEELVTFVRQVEPGALYLHDIDSGDYRSMTQSWKMRCDTCRARWPNDKVEAPDGAAGAYADWFTQVRRAVSRVRNPSGYSGRDCLIRFAGPLYTERFDDDATWRRNCRYFRILSERIPAGGNTLFCVREQVLRTPDGGSRTLSLGRLLARRGHGVATDCYAGGDCYINDHLFTPVPALANWFKGSRSLSFGQGHLHQDALQALDAVYLWNVSAPGKAPPPDPADARPLDPFVGRYPRERFPEVFGRGGWLETICRRLYGGAAGRPMASLLALLSPHGFGPTALLWYPFTRRLWNGETLFEAQYAREWRERLAVNLRALDCADRALQHLDEEPVRGDVALLRTALDVAAALLRLLVAYGGTPVRSPARRQAFLKDHRALARLVARASRFDFVDPLGGDVGTWKPAVALLKAREAAFR